VVFSHTRLDLLRSVNHPDMIMEINQMHTTWRAGYNKRFEQVSLSEAVRLLGALETPEEKKLPEKDIQPITALPDNFDLREQWPQCESLKEIRDQSNCGSCWAFGAAEAMSDRICIESKGKLQTRVSAEYILSCCISCGSCDGGYPASAWYFWTADGIPTGGLYQDSETCQPYSFPPCDHHVSGKYGPCGDEEYDTPTCKNTCVDGYKKKHVKDDLIFAGVNYSVPKDEQKIMTEIYNYGSVEVSFDVYEDFLNYKSGVYQHVTGNLLGGHAVKIIGWGVENKVKYWIVVNSWNEGWGDNGIVKILKGKNHLRIEENVVAGMPKKA